MTELARRQSTAISLPPQERRRATLTAPRVHNVPDAVSRAPKAQTASSLISSEAGAMFGGAESAMRSDIGGRVVVPKPSSMFRGFGTTR